MCDLTSAFDYLTMAIFAGLLANTLFGAWWPDSVVALAIAGWAVAEGRRAWAGKGCSCASDPETSQAGHA